MYIYIYNIYIHKIYGPNKFLSPTANKFNKLKAGEKTC